MDLKELYWLVLPVFLSMDNRICGAINNRNLETTGQMIDSSDWGKSLQPWELLYSRRSGRSYLKRYEEPEGKISENEESIEEDWEEIPKRKRRPRKKIHHSKLRRIDIKSKLRKLWDLKRHLFGTFGFFGYNHLVPYLNPLYNHGDLLNSKIVYPSPSMQHGYADEYGPTHKKKGKSEKEPGDYLEDILAKPGTEINYDLGTRRGF